MVRTVKLVITSYDLNYVMESPVLTFTPDSPEKVSETLSPVLLLRLKCYSKEDKKSFKFYFPKGEEKIQTFLKILNVKSTNELPDKEFQILTYDDYIFGISQIGDMKEVKYIPCLHSEEKCAPATDSTMLTYSDLDSLITESSCTNKPYYVKMSR